MAPFSLTSARAILMRTPTVMRALLDRVPPEWTGSSRERSWRATDVLGHLIHGDLEDWTPRAAILLAHGESEPFEEFDRSGFGRATEGKSLEELLDDFETVRFEALRRLDEFRLTDESLDRTGTHPSFGAVTLRELLATWTVHDLSHIGQVADSMARHYRDEVGPWRRYLPVLDRPEEDSG